MKKLNNKGMTTIEILLCFVLVAIITVSIYTTISSFNNKQNIESYKEKIMTYKNILTKTIQDDLIKLGVISASVTVNESSSSDNNNKYVIDFNFRGGTKKQLIITKILADDYNATGKEDDGVTQDDYFMIEYDGIEYPIPDVGESPNYKGEKVKDLRINNVYINTEGNVLTIYIGFYHPELSTKYGINIVCPLGYF